MACTSHRVSSSSSSHTYEWDGLNRVVIEHMRELRLRPRGERLSYEAIAQQLNDEGRTTRYGKPWTRAAVFQVLSR
jgi:Recombinase